MPAQPLDLTSPHGAIARGICFVAGDRNADSIANGLSRAREHVPQSAAPAAAARSPGARRPTRPRRPFGSAPAVDLQPNDPAAPIETLSGGNQQKIVMARWMRIGGKVLVLEDPTAGVDVGAKAEIYRLLADAVGRGLAVILISTDFEEVAAICHRALVFRDGRIIGDLAGGRAHDGAVDPRAHPSRHGNEGAHAGGREGRADAVPEVERARADPPGARRPAGRVSG